MLETKYRIKEVAIIVNGEYSHTVYYPQYKKWYNFFYKYFRESLGVFGSFHHVSRYDKLEATRLIELHKRSKRKVTKEVSYSEV